MFPIGVLTSAPPVASSVAITGDFIVGELLTGTYAYTSPVGLTESGSTYQWYRADDAIGTNSAAIGGATAVTHTAVTADTDKFVSFQVTPKDGFEFGAAVSSTWYEVLPATVAGGLLMFGSNAVGQLGDGTTTARSSPVQIGADLYVLISCSGATASPASAGIRENGTLWTWGKNTSGTLGVNDTTDRSSPTQVGGRTDWAFVDAGTSLDHMAALTDAGEAFVWGENANGQLGQGNTTDRSSPVQVSGTWISIATSTDNTLAVKSDGTLWGWGDNGSSPGGARKLGYFGLTFNAGSSAIAVGATVTGDTSGATGVVWEFNKTGGDYGTGTASGNIRFSSQTGTFTDGEDINSGTATVIDNDPLIFNAFSSPVQVSQQTDWEWVHGGRLCAVAYRDGKIFVWGSNFSGGLGLGHTNVVSSPTQLGAQGDWATISAGKSTSNEVWMVGLKPNGTLWAWGENGSGQLGQGNTTDRSSPIQIGVDTAWVGVVAGCDHWIGFKSDGSVWGCGAGGSGRLNNSSTGSRSSPTQIGTYTNIVAVAAGLHSGMIAEP